ncbi:MAG TPA: tartrate dehydrogenase, partial [Burkholderiaceae bacterium]|nr:tartrate dehydrogenase [Burkholderiaceae bacterium]
MGAHRIAVIAGDGIGTEVMPEGLRVLEAAATGLDIALEFEHFDFASWPYYERHGKMMPDDWKERLGGFEAIFFGAVGWPARIPDHVSLWGSLLRMRREFDQYVNLRPARLMPGVRSPLVGSDGLPRPPGAIDMLIVRENTEGEYSSVGGRMYEGTQREIVIQETVMSRVGVDRVLRFAFELARTRPRRRLTSATKSNGIAITMPYWDERVEAMAAQYPDVTVDRFHIDILAAHFVQRPDHFDVVVASNLFGDILSDLGPACTGTIGIAPSANLNPDRQHPSLFEPVHGSAPDIAGRGIANPIGQIWSGALMLEHLGHAEAAALVLLAIVTVPTKGPLTPDLGARAPT